MQDFNGPEVKRKSQCKVKGKLVSSLCYKAIDFTPSTMVKVGCPKGNHTCWAWFSYLVRKIRTTYSKDRRAWETRFESSLAHSTLECRWGSHSRTEYESEVELYNPPFFQYSHGDWLGTAHIFNTGSTSTSNLWGNSGAGERCRR